MLLPQKLFRLVVLMFLITSSSSGYAAVILQYHHVSDDTPKITSISPALFKQHLQYLDDNNFKIWPLPKLVDQLRSGEEIPDKVAVITFDDAYSSIYDIALPALKKYGWPFTVFVATQPVGSKDNDFMSWEELRELTKSGGTIANHTFSHAHLVRQQNSESVSQWLDRVRDEIERAEKRIKKETGQNHRLFAYPYGEYTHDIQKLVASLGFVGFGQHSGGVNKDHDLTALPRFPMNNIFGVMDQFKTKVSSLPFPAKEVRPDTLILNRANDLEGGLQLKFFPVEGNHDQLSCYASSRGKVSLKAERNNSAITVTIPEMPKAPVGRSRINCTMPSHEHPGRFRWFSYYWMLKKADGFWYEEQ